MFLAFIRERDIISVAEHINAVLHKGCNVSRECKKVLSIEKKHFVETERFR